MFNYRPSLQRTFLNPKNSFYWRSFLVFILLFACLALYWNGLLASQNQKKTDLYQQTMLRSAQLTKTLAVLSQTLFAGLDFVAQNLVAEYMGGNAEGFDRAVHTAISSYPAGSILQVAVADREGDIVYSNLQDPPRQPTSTSIRDRAHFRTHAEASSDSGLYVSQPVMGRVSKLWTIQISRAIRSQGRFEGVLVISVAPSYLSKFFREILRKPNDLVMLLRHDGAFMASSGEESAFLGKFVSEEHEFLLQNGAMHGEYDSTSSVDDVVRHNTWHRVNGFPLLVLIGLDKQALWEPLHEEIQTSLLRHGVGSVLLVLIVLIIGWLSLQRRKAQEQATRSEELLRKLVTQVPGGLFQLQVRADGNLRLPYVSPGMCKLHQMLGKAGGSDGQAWFAFIHPDDGQRVRTELLQASADLQPWQGRYRIVDEEGRLHWVQIVAQPERHGDDEGVLWHGYAQDVTLQHKMQEALRVSEQHLRLTMEAVHDGMWSWDLDTNLVHWDARCWEMLGYPAQAKELSRETMLGWMHPRDLEKFQHAVEAHLEHGETYHCEFRLRTATGDWLWVEARGDLADTAAGESLRMLGTHTDITKRVAQTQLVRALLDENACAILLVSPDRCITQANQRARSIFAAPGTSLVGQSTHIIHPDDTSFKSFEACYAELREQGRTHREWLFQLGDGTLRWHDVHGTLLDPQDPQGQVIWTIVDADDRHRAEIALRTAQQRLTAIIECFPSGVMLQERIFGSIVAMNQNLCNLLELPAPITRIPRGLEAKINQLLPADMLAEPAAPQHLHLSTVQRIELPLPSGRVFEVQRIPLWHEDRQLGLFWVVDDITQRKQRETLLEQQATTDTLTKLPNRRAFMNRIQQEYNAICLSNYKPGILLMIDIDFFKKVNDTWGHGIGDQVLQHLASVLRQNLRSGDMAARLGGEEFTVLLPQTDLHDGLQLAERVRAAIASAPATTDQGAITVTVSLGVSVLDASLSSIDEALNRSDTALYAAKHQGRNRVCTWSEGKEGT